MSALLLRADVRPTLHNVRSVPITEVTSYWITSFALSEYYQENGQSHETPKG